ncbi:hypothetical protein NMY22_g16353 [Coprinellus aureogranulatus]|nr:hypothetical protein NMY22_g16353 [Coprinellus aureogranulatus]
MVTLGDRIREKHVKAFTWAESSGDLVFKLAQVVGIRVSRACTPKQDGGCPGMNHSSLVSIRSNTSTSTTTELAGTGKRNACSGCKSVYYCSTDCQARDWNLLHRYQAIQAGSAGRPVVIMHWLFRHSFYTWLARSAVTGSFVDKGNLTALLLEVYKKRRLHHVEDTRAFPGTAAH